jgi:hypothetical protein
VLAGGAAVAQAATSGAVCGEQSRNGSWSLASRALFAGDDWPLVNIPLPAPDGRATLRDDEVDGLIVEGSNGRSRLVESPLTRALIEGQWSPDSSFLATTDSDGGEVGTWITRFYAVGRDGRAVPIDVLRDVTQEANRLPRCFEWEPANLALVGWLRGGREALVLAQVPPHSNCRNMGDLTGYRVSVPGGKILERVRDPQSRAEWRRHMGCSGRSVLDP